MAAYFFPIFQPVEQFIGPDITDEDPESTFQWLDLDISGGANLLQQFVLKALGVSGTLIFENGATQTFTPGQDILIPNASSLEGADANSTIEFSLLLKPDVTLDNTTSIGFNVGGTLYLLKNDPVDLQQTIPLFSTPIASIPIDDGGAFAVGGFNTYVYDFSV
ncbi:MAG: hypothetical protein AB7V46_20870 [Thermomicrobiales bacterium]